MRALSVFGSDDNVGGPAAADGVANDAAAAYIRDGPPHLARLSSQAQAVQYCRDHETNWFTRSMRSVSVDCNYDFKRWRRHQVATRHLRIWTWRNIVRSDNIRRLLFPELLLVGCTSSALCYYNLYLACPAEEIVTTLKMGVTHYFHPAMLALPLECFTITSMALGLLVTFKTQTSYSRFIEGRNLWGLLINESRAFCSRILARVPTAGSTASAGKTLQSTRSHACKLLRTFPIVLKYHLTEDGCNPHIEIGRRIAEAQVRAAVMISLTSELWQIWDREDEGERQLAERILDPDLNNRPLHVLHELSLINALVFANPALGELDGPAATEMDKSLTTMHNVLGACEKIVRTPIYTPYTKFTSRFLWVWCNALPFAMFPLVGPACTVPVSLLIAFFMFGIEDIGSRVEQPFDVMPLWQYCRTIEDSVLQLAHLDEELHAAVAKQIAVEPEVLEAEEASARRRPPEYSSIFEVDDEDLSSYMDPFDIQISREPVQDEDAR